MRLTVAINACLQFPHDPTFPWTVKSTSARSSAPSFKVCSLVSASARFAESSAAIRSARPQVQSLQARRLLLFGMHSAAMKIVSLVENHLISKNWGPYEWIVACLGLLLLKGYLHQSSHRLHLQECQNHR